MTNSEAILRLSVNKRDRLAMMSLRENNVEVIHAALARHFGTQVIADKAEPVLMLRIADQARLFELSDNADTWFARCANTQCDRLRNEAIREKANAS